MDKQQLEQLSARLFDKYCINMAHSGQSVTRAAFNSAIQEAVAYVAQASQTHEIHNQSLEKVGRIMESMKYADEDGGLSEWESGYNGAVKDLCTIVEKAKRN